MKLSNGEDGMQIVTHVANGTRMRAGYKLPGICLLLSTLHLAGCISQPGTSAGIGRFAGGIGQADGSVRLTYRVLGEVSDEARFSRESYRMLSPSPDASCEKLQFQKLKRQKADRLVKSLKDYLETLGEYAGEQASDRTARALGQFASGLVDAGNNFGVSVPLARPAITLAVELRQAIVNQARSEAARRLVVDMQPKVAAISTALKSGLGRAGKSIHSAIEDWEECERATLRLYLIDGSLSLPQKEARIRQFHDELAKLKLKETNATESLNVFDEIVKLHGDIGDPSKNIAQSIDQAKANINEIVRLIKSAKELADAG